VYKFRGENQEAKLIILNAIKHVRINFTIKLTLLKNGTKHTLNGLLTYDIRSLRIMTKF